ncbi:NnrS family protein [Gammaproteobacteria bacterium]|nr:NnrS family protein [Gammaproteobacteria bacterium]
MERSMYRDDLPIWNLGFRPFFLGAAYFGAASISVWLWTVQGGTQLYPVGLAASYWHAHEMLFGYAAAVIAGFLLTATRNWTGRQTLHRAPLAALFTLWLLARVTLLLDAVPPWCSAALDIAFNIWLLAAVATPIIAERQLRQYPILGKLVFLLACNLVFYAELLGYVSGLARTALYVTLYVIIGLILMMCRRLIPAFTQSGVGYAKAPRNSRKIDLASLLLYLGFFVAEVFFTGSRWSALFAGVLAPVLAVRACWWFTPGILRKPLVWGLHLAYLSLVAGFALFALVPFTGVSGSLAMHTMTVGGVGLVTVAMMARVSWGHSGRDLQHPPVLLAGIFSLLLLAAISRVAGPMLTSGYYNVWLLLAGVFWVAALLSFALRYTPVWLSARPDGKYG